MSTRGEFKVGDYVAWETPGDFQRSGTVQAIQQSERPGEYYRVEQDNGDISSVFYMHLLGFAVRYLAEYGDWVRLADGTAATVVRAQPAYSPESGQSGAVYDLMFKGGHEISVYHWDGEDHLVRASLGPAEEQMPLFTVVSQEA